jgi:hypothetical protein
MTNRGLRFMMVNLTNVALGWLISVRGISLNDLENSTTSRCT